jgi:hypothetical protein
MSLVLPSALNRSVDNELVIYNKVTKTAGTTMVFLILKMAIANNFTHAHVPLEHYFQTDLPGERSFLWHHYMTKWPYLSDEHIMFVDVKATHGFQSNERPNWINVVRHPIDRLVSQFYYDKLQNPNSTKVSNGTFIF